MVERDLRGSSLRSEGSLKRETEQVCWGLVFGVKLFAAGEEDGGAFEGGSVPGGGGVGVDVELADGGDGAAGEGGDDGGLAGKDEGDVADDFCGGAEVAGREEEAIGGRGLDNEDLLAGAGVKGEGAGDGGGVAVFDRDADGGSGLWCWSGGGGEGGGAGVFGGLGGGGGEGCSEKEGGEGEEVAHGWFVGREMGAGCGLGSGRG